MSTVKKGSGICDFHIFSPGENKEHISVSDLVKVFEKIPGGYKYLGAASTRYYFPLKEGGSCVFSLSTTSVRMQWWGYLFP